MENKSPDENNHLFEISRARYFYKFRSPTTLTIEEEITYVNKSDGIADFLPYDLNEFKPFLHIYDADGELLEFFRQDGIVHGIRIALPENKRLEKDRRKTVRLLYVKEYTPENSEMIDQVILHDEYDEYNRFNSMTGREENFGEVWLRIPLYKTANVYVYIEKYREYLFEAEYYISSQGECDIPEIQTEKGSTYAHFKIRKSPGENRLAIKYRHISPPEPTPSQFDSLVGYLGWHNCGIALGAVSCLAVYWIKHKPVTGDALNYSFADMLTFATLIITILVIIEGWLFDKNMNSEMVKRYDIVYKAMIAIMLIEIGIFYII